MWIKGGGRPLTSVKIKKEFEDKDNVKRNIANKRVHYVVSNYQHGVFHNDNIHSMAKTLREKDPVHID
jgi:hypothetical protein